MRKQLKEWLGVSKLEKRLRDEVFDLSGRVNEAYQKAEDEHIFNTFLVDLIVNPKLRKLPAKEWENLKSEYWVGIFGSKDRVEKFNKRADELYLGKDLGSGADS